MTRAAHPVKNPARSCPSEISIESYGLHDPHVAPFCLPAFRLRRQIRGHTEFRESALPVDDDRSPGSGAPGRPVIDPLDPDRYYYAFYLGGPVKPGGYLTFRTNSVSVRIDNLKVTRYY